MAMASFPRPLAWALLFRPFGANQRPGGLNQRPESAALQGPRWGLNLTVPWGSKYWQVSPQPASTRTLNQQVICLSATQPPDDAPPGSRAEAVKLTPLVTDVALKCRNSR